MLDDLRNITYKQSNFIKEMLTGSVEIDETYIGGSNANRHWDKKVPHSQGRNWRDKIPTLVMIARGGNVVVEKVPNVEKKTLKPIIRNYVEEGSDVYTDEWKAYNDLKKWYNHEIVNHRKKQYVNGKASTNTAENFNLQLKKTIEGTYHWISREHSQGYMNEIAFRFNNRKLSDHERFDLALSSTLGKSLSYKELTN
jgi:transposase-like protein